MTRATTRLLVAIASLVFATSMPVGAQPTPVDPPGTPVDIAPNPRRSAEDQLSLARVAVSEGGLLVSDAEVAALAAVLRARCAECSLTTSARQYSDRVFDLTRRDSRAWVAFLEPSGREPAHWPEVASWTVLRARWLRVYEAAGRVVRGEVVHECASPVHHWGAPYGGDLERATRAGWTRVNCGEGVRNAFWNVPTRGDS